LRENGFHFTEAVIYHTVAANLSDLKNVYYDILAFFSPSGINSLLVNFPDFKAEQYPDCRLWSDDRKGSKRFGAGAGH